MDLYQAMDNAEAFVKYVVKYALDKCPTDITFFNKFMDKTLQTRLEKLVNEPFKRLSYNEAIALLQVWCRVVRGSGLGLGLGSGLDSGSGSGLGSGSG